MSERTDAIAIIVDDARKNHRLSTASAKRVVRACKTLGLDDAEIVNVMAFLDYCDRETGTPYHPGIKRVWR